MASLWGIPLNQIKGVGEKRAALYQKLGITSAGALLRHFPRSYEDWSRTTAIADALPDTPCCIKGHAGARPGGAFCPQGDGALSVPCFRRERSAACHPVQQ